MEIGGWKTPGSLLGIRVSGHHDRRLLEAVAGSCPQEENGRDRAQTEDVVEKGDG